MALHVDYAAERAFARIIGSLRSARLDAELSQNALAATSLPVRGRAISEWETGAIEPTLTHLIQWSCSLGLRLVILGRNGELINSPIRQRPGESWVVFERRRLATPLKNRRAALGLSQDDVGQLVGVSRDSISRWELARVRLRTRPVRSTRPRRRCSRTPPRYR